MYDERCLDLAEAFLADSLSREHEQYEMHLRKLALLIQQTIEDYLEFDLKDAT